MTPNRVIANSASELAQGLTVAPEEQVQQKPAGRISQRLE